MGSRIQVPCPHLGGSSARVSPASGVERGQDQGREGRVELKRDFNLELITTREAGTKHCSFPDAGAEAWNCLITNPSKRQGSLMARILHGEASGWQTKASIPPAYKVSAFASRLLPAVLWGVNVEMKARFLWDFPHLAAPASGRSGLAIPPARPCPARSGDSGRNSR